MTRFSVTVLLVLAVSGIASAQSTLPGNATITFDKLYIHEDNDPELIEPKVNPDSLWEYFNLAHCQCSRTPPDGFNEGTFGYLLTLQNPSGAQLNRDLQIWVGSQCNGDTEDRNEMCRQLEDDIGSIDELGVNNGSTIELRVFDLMTPRADACTPAELDAAVWAIADGDGDGTLDYFVSKSVKADSRAPTLPTEFRATGGDEAIEISWKAPLSTVDTYAYQALCARADDDMPAKATGRPGRRYQTGLTLCGINESIDLGAGVELAPVDGEVPVTLPDALRELDDEFLCGEAFSPTATGMRIDGLENGVKYKIVVLAVDKFQNATGTFFTRTVTPVPSIDFWEDLHDRGSDVDGGLCLVAQAYGDDSTLTRMLRGFRDGTLARSAAGRWLAGAYYATLGKLGAYVAGAPVLQAIAAVVLAPLVAVALLWHWLTLPGLLALIGAAWLWRRRHALPRWLLRAGALASRATRLAAPGSRAAAAVLLLVLAGGLAPQAAHAGGYQPYWETDANTDENLLAADDPSLVKWHAGIRVGPYVPEIDEQLGGPSPGPYEQMFGGSRVLPMLDVDRILWTGLGQLGVGISLGYMQKSARTFTQGSGSGDADRPRSADENTFRMIPIALSAVYRFTTLDDAYGIPVVPYLRGGLAYHVWWLRVSGGRFGAVCKDGDMAMGCSRDDKALGGSLGVQGSIGLAIRAERIDASTAMSMRQSGIMHAGIYAELALAKVDGFGSSNKLSVGDRTWFAGVNFEF